MLGAAVVLFREGHMLGAAVVSFRVCEEFVGQADCQK